jgi:hypothetical protein
MGGNVTGPASSTDTAIALWNGTSGTVIQDSVVTVDSTGNVRNVANLYMSGEIGASKITCTDGVFFDSELGLGSGSGAFNVDSSGNLQAITLTGPQVAITAGGTANALTATYPQFPAALVDGLTCEIVPTADNTTTTPTFSPNGATAETITKRGGAALVAGDIKNLAPIFLEYNSANTRWELLNPATLPETAVTFTDVTTNNVSTSKHGFAPKAPNDATKYLDGTGAYSVPAGAGVAYNAISGNLPSSMTGTHTTATMSVSAGQAADSTNAVYITGAGYSWAVSNGNAINGYQGGTTLPNSSTIHMYLCTGASGTGTFASTSLTPTLPTGYAVSYRRIFSFNTNSSGAPLPYKAFEAEGGSLICYLTTQLLDISTTTLGASQTLYTLTVPTGIKVNPIMRFMGASASSHTVIITSGDETDVAPSAYASGTVPLWDLQGVSVDIAAQLYVTTNTSGQIGARASAANGTFYATTRGFKDFRRS